MSVAEIKAELQSLSPGELAEVEQALQKLKQGEPIAPPADPKQFFGSLEGVMKFGPGWDQPEPAETWNAMRDDTPL